MTADVRAIQAKLSEIGLLDPPADGIWGGTSSWALGQLMGGPVQPEALGSQIVQDAIASAQPLPLNPGDDLAGRMVKAAIKRGDWIARSPKCFNHLVFEGTNLDGSGNGDPKNEFAAARVLVQVDKEGVPHIATIPGGGAARWVCTTEPSRYWTENPMNSLGAARVVPGQYKAWTRGVYHDDLPALLQAGELAVQRDLRQIYKRYGPIYRGSDFGIHHHGDYSYPKNDEGRSSAGCWVTWSRSGQVVMIGMLDTDARYQANHGYKFMAANYLHSELADQPAPPPPPPGPNPPPPTDDSVSRKCTHIWMTVFAGSSDAEGGKDPENSAYTGVPIDPEEVGFSVSYKFLQPRPWVRCWASTGKVVDGPLVDVGPGLTNDPWWSDPSGQPGARNGAGLDATPAAWRMLGLDPVEGKVRVDFQLIKPPAHRLALWRVGG